MRTPFRISPWQHWHTALIYAPLIPWFLWLCLRYRMGVTDLLRVNPRLKFGGATIDSKFERYLPFRDCEYAIPTLRILGHEFLELNDLAQRLDESTIDLPVIVKPDIGILSKGVHRFSTLGELKLFLQRKKVDYLIQPYITYPFEYAIYYYRLPGEPHGRILDLTERVLPRIVGDGYHSVAELIDARTEWNQIAGVVREQAQVSLDAVPTRHETILLRVAARGGQGALFVDSRHLITPELEGSMDKIAMPADFFLGKLDFKVDSQEDLLKGRNLKLLEVNGITSELNHIYDLRCNYYDALQAIARQFELFFIIARKNRSDRMPSVSEVAWNLYKLGKHVRGLDS